MEHSTKAELLPDRYYSSPKYSEDDENRWKYYAYVDDLYTQILNKYKYYKSCKELRVLEGEMQDIYEKSKGQQMNTGPSSYNLEHMDFSFLHRFFMWCWLIFIYNDCIHNTFRKNWKEIYRGLSYY